MMKETLLYIIMPWMLMRLFLQPMALDNFSTNINASQDPAVYTSNNTYYKGSRIKRSNLIANKFNKVKELKMRDSKGTKVNKINTSYSKKLNSKLTMSNKSIKKKTSNQLSNRHKKYQHMKNHIRFKSKPKNIKKRDKIQISSIKSSAPYFLAFPLFPKIDYEEFLAPQISEFNTEIPQPAKVAIACPPSKDLKGNQHGIISQTFYLPEKSLPPKLPVSPVSCPPQHITTEQCMQSGIQSYRIIGGTAARHAEFPWVVQLFPMMERGELYGMGCGGTLISEGWIVSSAHCFHKRSNYDIILASIGSIYMPKDYCSLRQVFQVMIHPNYDEIYLTADIALLQLVEYVSFSKDVSPVCLATTEDVNNMLNNEPHATVVGWGRMHAEAKAGSSVLMKANLDVISAEKCRSFYYGRDIFPITESNICTYTAGMDACQGDSGGGLFHQRTDGGWVQVGIVSWGVGCAKARNPGVYTRISDYLTWITEVLHTVTCRQNT